MRASHHAYVELAELVSGDSVSLEHVRALVESLGEAIALDRQHIGKLERLLSDVEAYRAGLGKYAQAAPVVALHSVKEPGPETRPSSPPAAPDAQPSGPGNPEGA